MKGSVNAQVKNLFKHSGINRIGESKHAAKEEIRANLHAVGKSATWHSIGKQIGIHSYSTADKYRDIWRQVGNYARSEYGIKDMTKIADHHIRSYLEHRVAQNVSATTFKQNCAAIEKMGAALKQYAEKFNFQRSYNFSKTIEEFKATGAHKDLTQFRGDRAYDDPRAVIKSIHTPEHHLLARLQLEGGCRVSEAKYIKESQLRGVGRDKISGEKVGRIHVDGKGGKPRMVQVSERTYRDLEKAIAKGEGLFRVEYKEYLKELKNSALNAGEKIGGQASHGLRWNFAQERFMECQQEHNGNMTYVQAQSHVSEELGHQRAEITEHYLGE